MNTLKAQWLRITVHIGHDPLAMLVWRYSRGQLTADPIRGSYRTGKTALILLMFRWPARRPIRCLGSVALKVRCALGCSVPARGDSLVRLCRIDYSFDPALLRTPLALRLWPGRIHDSMAITSTRGWMKRLGPAWKKLHRWVYLAALLVIVHFVWLVKADIREPLTYGAVVVALLMFRIPRVRQWVSLIRHQPHSKPHDSLITKNVKRLPQ
jgi:sulfoxide reductase heme-binding subunit YedZ